MKQMSLIEMDGFLKGKCIPCDLKVNETNAEYLVRKFAEADAKISALYEDHQKAIESIKQADAAVKLAHEKFSALAAENAGLKSEAPLGAIENGRAFADRLENYQFECEGGNLNMCSDWQEFRRCFEYLSEWVMHSQTEHPATDDFLAEVKTEARKEGAYFVANRMLAAWEAGFIDDTAKNAADIARMILTSTEFMANAPEGDFDRSFSDGVLEDIAAMLQAEPVSNSDELPLDYLQGHKDGLEWAAQLAEANHPQTGDWLYDDPIDLARAIRKGPDMPTVQAGNYPVTPDGWISCSERMPDKLIPVMVMYEDGEMWSAMWNGNRWDDGTEYPDPHSVTHWREMPAAPQQEVK